MFAKKIKCKDFNGVEREQTFYFAFLRNELIDLEWRTPGGLEAMYKRIVEELDGAKLADEFKKLITMTYGVKDPSGTRFIKSKELTDKFTQTMFFDTLYVELATNSDAAAEFVNGIFPQDVMKEIQEQKAKAEKAGVTLVKNEQPLVDTATAVPASTDGQVIDPITGQPIA